LVICSRILWKSKKDELKDKEANIDVTSHLAYAIVATIATVKHKSLCNLAFYMTFLEILWLHTLIKSFMQ
jgi:hypothetical protein